MWILHMYFWKVLSLSRIQNFREKGFEQVLKQEKDIAFKVDEEMEPLTIGNSFTGAEQPLLNSVLQECPI